MLTKIASTLILALSLGFGSLIALPTTADARPHMMLMEHHHHHHGGIFFGGGPFFFGPPLVYDNYGAYYGGGCYWLRVKAERTGSRYWWHRYNECRFGVY